MRGEFEHHARAECVWAWYGLGVKEAMGSIADRIRAGDDGEASEPGSATRSAGVLSHDGLSERIRYRRQRRSVGPEKFNACP